MISAYDVVLQPTLAFKYPLEGLANPPISGRFELRPDLWIGQLPDGVSADQIADACEPRGLNFKPNRLYGFHYAFIREVIADPYPSYNWDEDLVLGRTLFVSRLIHPTTISGKYSARIILDKGILTHIIPGHVRGVGTHAWIFAHEYRDWLTEENAISLRETLFKYQTDVPDRVRRARAHLDQAFHGFYLDQCIASVVSSIESLLKTERRNATGQFALRFRCLAAKFDEEVSKDEALRFYNDRSNFVHGSAASLENEKDEIFVLYEKFERVQRAAILKASTDQSFSKIFQHESSISEVFGVV